jgi:RNA polymerase sigma-B factor
VRWHEFGDRAARDELVRSFTPLVRSLVRRYKHTSESYEDLMQVAQLGLVKAINGYDAALGFAFTAYAVPTILGELRKHFRTAGWAVHVPRAVQERVLELRQSEQVLTEESGRAPTVGELAEFMERTTEEVLDALQARNSSRPMSLDAPRSGGGDQDEGTYLETIGEEDPRFELLEADADATVAIRLLRADQRELLRLRFVEELTQSEIAGRLGVSQMQISRLLRRCLDQLRESTEAVPF